MFFFIFLIILIVALVLIQKNKNKERIERYNTSEYALISGNDYHSVHWDKGNRGEYQTFLELERLPAYKKLLVNLYIPKKDSTTTELDLVMVSEYGIHVFESKNYSGWIFGNEKNKFWMQTFKTGDKNRFYNPIWQNRGHINALKELLEIEDDNVIKSCIVFGNDCEFKDLTVTSKNMLVFKRNQVYNTLSSQMIEPNKVFTREQLESTYYKLREYILADNATKLAHVENVRAIVEQNQTFN
ncbi:MAG: NERD domain-containing protein [Clostridiales bacterium]|nr:NERD domain-containing protein [Clostridiales bacterium]